MKIGVNFKPLFSHRSDLKKIEQYLLNKGYVKKEKTDFFLKLELCHTNKRFLIRIFKTGDFSFYGYYNRINRIHLSNLISKSMVLLENLKSNNFIQAEYPQKINFLFFGVKRKLKAKRIKKVIAKISKKYFKQCKIINKFQNEYMFKLEASQERII